MPSVAIIGASRGIGFGLAEYYAKNQWEVIATQRNPDDGSAKNGNPNRASLEALGNNVRVAPLDVRDEAALSRLADSVTSLDLLIHNAGVHDRDHSPDEVMAINAKAPFRVVDRLMPALRRGEQKKLLLMTSQLGARRGRRAPLGVYGESKAQLNDEFRIREPAWRSHGIIAVVMHPGWVRTDMGGPSAPVSIEQSVGGITRVLESLSAADAGRFVTWEGRDHPW